MNDTPTNKQQLEVINRTQPNNDVIAYYNNNIDKLIKWAESIKTSKAVMLLKDKNGVVSTDDIVATVLTGMELGMKRMQALRMADKLSNDGYLSIIKGQNYGLDAVTSTENIHVIPTQNGRQTFLGIHIVQKLLIENKIDIQILQDYAPYYQYYVTDTSTSPPKNVLIPIEEVEDEQYKIRDKFCIVSKTTSKDEIKDAGEKGKVFIQRYEIGKRSAVKLTRKGRSDVYYAYTTIDATNEGVYPGRNKFNEVVEVDSGNAWIKHTRSKMMKTCVERAGRIIADDIFQGVYTVNELDHFIASNQINPDDPTIIQIVAKDEE